MQRAFQEELRRTLLKYALAPVLLLALLGALLIVSSWHFYVVAQNERSLLLAKEVLERIVQNYEDHVDLLTDEIERAEPADLESHLAPQHVRRGLYTRLYHAVNVTRDGTAFYLLDGERRVLLGSRPALPAALPAYARWGVFERLQKNSRTTVEFVPRTHDADDALHDLAIGRSITAQSKDIGYLLFLIPADYLASALPVQDARFILVDAYDNVVLHRGKSFQTPLGKLAPAVRGTSDALIDDGDETYYATQISLLDGCHLYALTPVRSILTHYCIGLAVLAALVLLLVPAIYGSVRRESLRQLVLRNEAEARAAVVSEMRQLEAQFKPHFLLNTLANIKFMIRLDPASAMAMVQALSTLLRYSINNEVKAVTLAEDLAYTHSYIKIQKYRYGDRLRYREHIDDTLLHQTLPKLLFQPLLENAIKYGECEDGTIDLTLSVRRAEEAVLIEVADRGRGIAPAPLKELQRRLRDGQNESAHTGLYNVHRRLVLLYGEDCGLTIACPGAGGAVITLRLPYIRKEGQST